MFLPSTAARRERRVVVLEVTTTGPNPRIDRVIDIAAVDVSSGVVTEIALPVSEDALKSANAAYLSRAGYSVSGLRERASSIPVQVVRDQLVELSDMLRDSTVVGDDPALTTAFVRRVLDRVDRSAQWHPRLVELAAVTAGAMGIPVTNLPTVRECAVRWGVAEADLFTAAGMAETVARCLSRMSEECDRSKRGLTLSVSPVSVPRK